ncbi:MAG: hypothetical protein K9N49_06950 [Candidatus Marinimicrobia bacterium]|nr:hypothetical protein [Candidatus Neomarinimicrobiota bacterium]
MKRHRGSGLGACLLLGGALLWPGPVAARVFSRGAARAVALEARALGAAGVQEYVLEINGAPARVAVMSTARGPAGALAGLRAAEPPLAAWAGPGAAFGLRLDADRVTRYLAVRLRQRGCVVLRLEQTPAEFERSLRPPPSRELPVLLPPGATLTLWLARPEARLTTGLFDAPGSPAAVRAFYHRQLSQDGWTRLPPLVDPAHAPFDAYAREERLLLLSTQAVAGRGGTRAVVLMKTISP